MLLVRAVSWNCSNFHTWERILGISNTARHGRNQEHDTEETEEAEDLGVCVAGDNSSQAAEILVNRTEDTKEHKGKTN